MWRRGGFTAVSESEFGMVGSLEHRLGISLHYELLGKLVPSIFVFVAAINNLASLFPRGKHEIEEQRRDSD